MTRGESGTRFRFSVEHWAAFWAGPHPMLAGRIVTPDVLAYWPGETEPARGVTAYQRRIGALLDRTPALRLAVVEHATAGELLFVRWAARTYGFGGIDRLRLRDGLVSEIRIYCDPGLLGAFAAP